MITRLLFESENEFRGIASGTATVTEVDSPAVTGEESSAGWDEAFEASSLALVSTDLAGASVRGMASVARSLESVEMVSKLGRVVSNVDVSPSALTAMKNNLCIQ